MERICELIIWAAVQYENISSSFLSEVSKVRGEFSFVFMISEGVLWVDAYDEVQLFEFNLLKYEVFT